MHARLHKTSIPTYCEDLAPLFSCYLVLPYSIKQIKPAGDAIKRNSLAPHLPHNQPV